MKQLCLDEVAKKKGEEGFPIAEAEEIKEVEVKGVPEDVPVLNMDLGAGRP